MYLPTTRLGSVTRRKLFSLPPVVPALASAPSPAASTARLAHATLRKSFRKTLQTISGFRVRMRTVFVPYVLLPADGPGIGESDDEDDEDERERREAGSDEHTVVLCVEIENSGESGRRIGFSVDSVDVQIGGEGAKAILIGWQERMGSKHGAFPLAISATEQYNLLYAVSFLRAPGDIDGFSLTSIGDATNGDMQRAVTINIFGRPFLLSEQLSISDAHKLITEQDLDEACKAGTVSFPTQVFSSRWNCVLDLSSNQNPGITPELDADASDFGAHSGNNALPEPASPFPTFSPRTGSMMGFNAFPPTPAPAVAGQRRPTLPETPFLKWSARSSTPTTSRPGPQTSFPANAKRTPANKLGITAPAPYPTTPTTYAPPPVLFESDEYYGSTPATAMMGASDPYAKQQQQQPTTPAYPAYPPHSALPPTPASLGPVANPGGSVVGPSVEIRRERGSGGGVVPRTPGSGGLGERGRVSYQRGVVEGGPSVVVSIGLLLEGRRGRERGAGNTRSDEMIFPMDVFGLDVFVYNRSERTRVFEVSYPHRRRRRQEDRVSMGWGSRKGKGIAAHGILPLDNRVRVGYVLGRDNWG